MTQNDLFPDLLSKNRPERIFLISFLHEKLPRKFFSRFLTKGLLAKNFFFQFSLEKSSR